MRRNMCAQFSSIITIAMLALFAQGCTRSSVALWVDPDDILLVSSQPEIEAKIRTLFSNYQNGSERFSTTEVSTENSRFLFVAAYPYRGRAVFGVYCFEQINREAWCLRAVVPVMEALQATPSFVAEDNAVKVLVDGDVILKINSTAGKMHGLLDHPVQR